MTTTTKAELEEWKKNPLEAFKIGLECGFERWDVLTLAVANGWGTDGVGKRRQMINTIIEAFKKPNRSAYIEDDIQDYLEKCMIEHFNTEVEDGSVQWIAKLSVTLFRDCMVKKDFTGLCKLRSIPVRKPVVDEADAAASEPEEDEGDEDEGETEDEAEEDAVVDLPDPVARPFCDVLSCWQVPPCGLHPGAEKAHVSLAELEETVKSLEVKEERPRHTPQIDADGFETVQRNKGRRR